MSVLKKLNAAIVQGSASWGQRAAASLFEYDQTALVYMFADESSDALALDWRLWLMESIITKMQEQRVGINPLIVPFLQTPPPGFEMKVPQLSTVLNVKETELPTFILLHPVT